MNFSLADGEMERTELKEDEMVKEDEEIRDESMITRAMDPGDKSNMKAKKFTRKMKMRFKLHLFCFNNYIFHLYISK